MDIDWKAMHCQSKQGRSWRYIRKPRLTKNGARCSVFAATKVRYRRLKGENVMICKGKVVAIRSKNTQKEANLDRSKSIQNSDLYARNISVLFTNINSLRNIVQNLEWECRQFYNVDIIYISHWNTSRIRDKLRGIKNWWFLTFS